ncbi:MAG: tRNA preQ1(34) S-adenosylmethionine ribosyltransferase-isomerase QueA [Syntrophobacteraceae bacterium]|nr:tRNA preQ1(34) S-adenosylmethionine ribosyltransferase-isomerase QueA [Syntrophobacteraceae bacterium]
MDFQQNMAEGKLASFRIEDYDYELPPELIAQHPAPARELSRLLVLDRSAGTLRHSRFDKIGQYLRPGDLLVVNDTRVVPARLVGRKETGGRVEFLVLDPYKDPELGETRGYRCLTKASKPVRQGQIIEFSEGIRAEVVSASGDGLVQARFLGATQLVDLLDRIGRTPLPPYIERDAGAQSEGDLICYQTEYAKHPGAIAAPTAGLHFTKSLLHELGAAGIELAALTLHVGYGTFSPIRCEDFRDHRMHSEYIEVGEASARAINRAKGEKRRIVAVGTTVVRTLEWVFAQQGEVRPFSGMCDHFIYPGYGFQVVDCMVTNFHVPKSSLILLVSAFAGRSQIASAYREAVCERYRFFSYGDAMLIL